ncbi:MAG: haloacid dehalogenase [Chloroflexi bacterium]|nr:haloacid dehalogenase [Chloroflexota bacterium]
MALPLDDLAERVQQDFEARNTAREQALARTRRLIRHCARAIQAVHRDDEAQARALLEQAHELAQTLRADLEPYPDLYYAGYTQDALKEYAEANIVFGLLRQGRLPDPDDLGLPYNTFMRGLAEAVGELRRHVLNILRNGYSAEAETTLAYMDDIYGLLVTLDYPDAITGGLRRLTDIARSLLERTRGELTMSLRLQVVEQALARWAPPREAGAET